jgi:hypothetical protein
MLLWRQGRTEIRSIIADLHPDWDARLRANGPCERSYAYYHDAEAMTAIVMREPGIPALAATIKVLSPPMASRRRWPCP